MGKKKKVKKRKLGRHPWDKWFKHKRFVLTRGKHFSGMVHAMSVQVRHAAWKRDLQVSIKVKENSIVVEKVD